MSKQRKTIYVILFSLLVLPISMGQKGCESSNTSTAPTSIAQELAKTEIQQEVHLKNTPPPKLERSQERLNLKERLTRFNTDSKVSYIYLINYGKVMGFYTVKGKVSSVNSLLTQPEQPIFRERGGMDSRAMAAVTVPSPDLDGSYGSNGDAIFFFTTDSTYVEWRGDYMLCDKPLKMSTPPELVIDVVAENAQAEVE